MVQFRPLTAWEYSPSAGDFASLIAPPYDVIGPEQRKSLVAANPANVVRISLPEPENGLDKYAAAARTLAGWLDGGVLERSQPAFYVIEQTFSVANRKLVRTGVFGQVRLVPWGQGIYPHEVTLPKPRQDRLNLFRATRVVPGPTFSLFADEPGSGRELIGRIVSGKPYRAADGPEGSFDRVWKVTEPGLLREIERAFENESFFIADGHHRYETALAYRDEIAAGKPLPDGHPANFVLTCAVPFDDPGLVILATHRLLSLDGAASFDAALAAMRADYDIHEVPSLAAFDGAAESAPAAIALYASHRSWLLARKPAAGDAFVRQAGQVMAEVNTFEVLKTVLPHFFPDVQRAIDDERIKYTHSLAEALSRVDAGAFDAAIVLAPLSVRAMTRVASAGLVMPPKSTYFYPKLPTGVVIKPLE